MSDYAADRREHFAAAYPGHIMYDNFGDFVATWVSSDEVESFELADLIRTHLYGTGDVYLLPGIIAVRGYAGVDAVILVGDTFTVSKNQVRRHTGEQPMRVD